MTKIDVIGEGTDKEGKYLIISDEAAEAFMRDDLRNAQAWVQEVLETNADRLLEALDELKQAEQDLIDFMKEKDAA